MAEGLRGVEGEQNIEEELLVLLFEGYREAVDNAAKDFQQLGNAVVCAWLVKDKPGEGGEMELGQRDSISVAPIEYEVDILADASAEIEHFAVDAVEKGLEVVTLAGILAVKELQELQHDLGEGKTVLCVSSAHVADEMLVDVGFDQAGIKVAALQELEEELVNVLRAKSVAE